MKFQLKVKINFARNPKFLIRVNIQFIWCAFMDTKGLDLSHSSFSNLIVYVLPLLMYTAYNFIRNKYLVIQKQQAVIHLIHREGMEMEHLGLCCLSKRTWNQPVAQPTVSEKKLKMLNILIISIVACNNWIDWLISLVYVNFRTADLSRR